MSALSLGSLAAERDSAKQGDQVRTATETLVAIIPTEVLATYTALVAITVTATTAGHYEPFRWGAYGVFVVLAAIAPISSFRTKISVEGTPDPRSVPLAECAAAAFAAAAWGLVMPGTPLDMVLRGTALTLGTSGIVLGAGTLLAFVSTFLKRANDRGAADEPDASTDDKRKAETVDLLGYQKLSGARSDPATPDASPGSRIRARGD